MKRQLINIVLFVCIALFAPKHAFAVNGLFTEHCQGCDEKAATQTGVYLLEYGRDALMARAWLTQNASQSISVQYFIWSDDKIGILAAESLLRAANRGVNVRVVVDDFIVKADSNNLLALQAHPNIQIRIYNPKHNVGVSKIKRIYNLLTQFRDSNQRMHDKVAIFDGEIGITGGRNMADEYFDFNQEYSFRDRDILVMGKSVETMQFNFEQFWQSSLSKPIELLLDNQTISAEQVQNYYIKMAAFANNTENFTPQVRDMIANLSDKFSIVMNDIVWTEKAEFIHDIPGKNDGKSGLAGGGITSEKLIEQLTQAKREVLIQSPYLVLPDEGIALFEALIKQGVTIKVSTNSLLSTDNLFAFSGYHKIRNKLLDIGVQLYEYKPNPEVRQQLYQQSSTNQQNNTDPIFALHAKSMVIDQHISYVGSFNLDPRSINLNTEVGVLLNNESVAAQLHKSISTDMHPDNSWLITGTENPDNKVSFYKRLKMSLIKNLPMQAVL